jgi:hypothetical protein
MKGKRKKEQQKDLIRKSITEETGSKSNTRHIGSCYKKIMNLLMRARVVTLTRQKMSLY